MADGEYRRFAHGVPQLRGGLCSVSGCGTKRQARGLCKSHWARWKKHGDPLLGAKNPLPELCEIEDCGTRARSRWGKAGAAVCGKHYLRMFISGKFEATPRLDRPPGGICTAPECAELVRSARAQHCERHYYQIRRSGAVGVDRVRYDRCQYCDGPSDGNRFCGGRCNSRYVRGNPIKRECLVCGIGYSPVQRHGRDVLVCSASCHKRRIAEQSRVWRLKATARPEFVDSQRHNQYLRRARKAGVPSENIDRALVFVRDKWRCHLCGDRIPKVAVWPEPMFGTLDHVVPLLHGGPHTYANIKAAHLVCNLRKGAKRIGQSDLFADQLMGSGQRTNNSAEGIRRALAEGAG